MPGRESVVGDGRSRPIDQKQIVDCLSVNKFHRYFNAKSATFTGEIQLQIENCMMEISEDMVASGVWQRCDNRR